MATPKTVRILSFDGGGCRGFFSTLFLERFVNQWGINPNEIYKNFDVIAGSSVGGIQACAYANGLPISTAKSFFLNEAPWVFTIRTALDVVTGSINASNPSNRPDTFQKIVLLGTSDPFYASIDPDSNYGNRRLQRALGTTFGDVKLNELQTNVLITSYEQITSTPILFSNVEFPDYTGSNLYVKDVVLSTASAPVYLPSAYIGNNQYIDGGLFQNNPSNYALELAKILYPNATRYCLLSIGTGLGDIGFHIPSGEPPPTGGIPLLFSLMGICMASNQEGTARLLDEIATYNGNKFFYYRFQTVLDPTLDTGLDNSDSSFFTYLVDAMNAQYNQDAYKISQFISRLNDE